MPYTPAPDGWWQEFLGALPAHTAKLAVVKADGSPHVAPVWIDLDGDDVDLHDWRRDAEGQGRSCATRA